MRFRPLALFVFAVGIAVLAGEMPTIDAQEKVNKKKKVEPPAAKPEQPAPADPNAKPSAKPLTSALATPGVKDAAALAKVIDAAVARKLAEAKVPASAPCSDEEFLRRAYLDITGVIPSADKAKAFLDDKATDKRTKLIDELLKDPNFGRRMADIWTAKLFPVDSANRFVLKEPFYKWFEAQFNANPGWDKLVSSLVTATGTVADNPAVTYFLANRAVDKLTDTTTQHFLGIQLQCAQCHNHPFTSWKQTEYWGMASFYGKVKADNPKNANKGGDNTTIGVNEGNGRSKAKDFFPESAKNVPPKFLGAEEPKLGEKDPYRPALAKWMVSPENPFFTRAMVNRTWAHLFGRGFVNPVDDMLVENEASHPELMDSLAVHMGKAGEFDLKYLIKAICLSETYQRTSKPLPTNKDDEKLFSHMSVKVLSPEQLFDSLGQVTGNLKDTKGVKGAAGAPKGGRVGNREQFVTFFLAGAETANAIDYEAGIPQALRLMNSAIANNLATLSRRPTADEVKKLTEYVDRVGAPTAYGDILWAVLNSSEFTLVR